MPGETPQGARSRSRALYLLRVPILRALSKVWQGWVGSDCPGTAANSISEPTPIVSQQATTLAARIRMPSCKKERVSTGLQASREVDRATLCPAPPGVHPLMAQPTVTLALNPIRNLSWSCTPQSTWLNPHSHRGGKLPRPLPNTTKREVLVNGS